MSTYLYHTLASMEAENMADRIRREAGPGWIERRPLPDPPRRRSRIAVPIRRTLGAAFVRAGEFVRGGSRHRSGAPSAG
jgi:hypothetical protein